jgi:hypothetical protein
MGSRSDVLLYLALRGGQPLPRPGRRREATPLRSFEGGQRHAPACWLGWLRVLGELAVILFVLVPASALIVLAALWAAVPNGPRPLPDDLAPRWHSRASPPFDDHTENRQPSAPE